MKKYSEEHLESVPPEYILACEQSIANKHSALGGDTCMAIILNAGDCYDDWCPKYMKYEVGPQESYICPCLKFGKSKSIKLMQNLVDQWKKWSGVKAHG